MVPVVQPANRPKGVARAVARLKYDTTAGSSLRPRWLSGSFCQTSRASSTLGEATKIASRTSGRVTAARSLARSRSRASSRPWESPSAPTASRPSPQAASSSNGNNGVRRTKNPDGVYRWPALSRSVTWRARIRLRGRDQEHPVPGGLDGGGRSQQDQGDPGGSLDQFGAGPRPPFPLARVPVSLHPRAAGVSGQKVEAERALEPVKGGMTEGGFPGGLVQAVVEVGQPGRSVAEVGVDDPGV